MSSLTPLDKRDEVANQAFEEGLLNGLFTLIPATGAVYALTQQSPGFRRATNMQARTALCIMPALFMFAFTAEEKVVHRMKEMAKEAQHSHDSVQWAEHQLSPAETAAASTAMVAQQKELNDLYKRAVYESGVRVVPGHQLSMLQIASNYVAENPFKVLSSLAVPGVAWIFYGRSGQEHLTFSMKVMHTRVFGQFATISALLGVMGFKSMMDHQGKYITEAQANARVQEMQELRTKMLARLEASNNAQAAYEKEIQKAHDQDVKEGHATEHKKAHHHHHKKVHHDAVEGAAMAVSPKEE